MAVKPIPDGYHTITPYLTARNASEAIEFYKTAFGATEIGRLVMPDGGIAHAEIKIGDSNIMISEESEDWGNLSPQALNGSPVNLCIYVEDANAVFTEAISAGA
ncbi:MAG: PhnB protein, partial [Cocleimonas sp.]